MELNQVLTIFGLGFTVLSSGFSAAMFCVIKFNDFFHLQKVVDEIKESSKKTDNKITEVLERVSKIEGICATKAYSQCK